MWKMVEDLRLALRQLRSIFSQILGYFRGPSLNRRYAGIEPSTMPGGLAAGRRWWRMLFCHLGRAQSLRWAVGV
jgi:hypothetical protein